MTTPYRESAAPPKKEPPDLRDVDVYTEKLIRDHARTQWLRTFYGLFSPELFVVVAFVIGGITIAIWVADQRIACERRGGVLIENQCIKVEKVPLP